MRPAAGRWRAAGRDRDRDRQAETDRQTEKKQLHRATPRYHQTGPHLYASCSRSLEGCRQRMMCRLLLTRDTKNFMGSMEELGNSRFMAGWMACTHASHTTCR